MRISEALPQGRIVHVYHPELFSDHEEVIIYTRNEFKRNYLAMKECLEYVFKQYCQIDRERDFELASHWARIMERIHFIRINMELFLDKKPFQAYLDTYVKIPELPPEDLLEKSMSKVSAESLGVGWL